MSNSLHVWVDADALPRAARDILFRAIERMNVPCSLVANRPVRTPNSPLFDSVLVPAGFDVADEHIVEQINAGDLVITQDIPLAAAAIERGAFAMDPRGREHTEDNIGERLATRDLLDELRSTGVQTGGPPPYDQKASHAFASALDRFLTKHGRKKP